MTKYNYRKVGLNLLSKMTFRGGEEEVQPVKGDKEKSASVKDTKVRKVVKYSVARCARY